MSQSLSNQTRLWDETLIRRYDLAGPRYTSYPTAPQFSEENQLEQWLAAMQRSNESDAPLSIYLHIPFCDTVCYYCGCNKIVTANKSRAVPYLEALHKELSMQAKFVNKGRPVNQLHWGGGTPTYISDQQMADLMTAIDRHFPLLKDDSGEYSIEIHPQTVSAQRMEFLRTLGFNRVSLGVQDFNPDVQKAVNRFNSEEEVKDLLKASRELGFNSMSMDLIYGLPRQTENTFRTTLAKVIDMRPDRLSLFNYAHMPHLFKVQKQIDARELPEPQEKLQILHNSIDQLVSAGYVYIGMDHFALPDDELTVAQKNGVLHRNFQGYATHGNCELLAFGVSSINSIGNAFFQNHKDINQYQEAIMQRDTLPVTKGIVLDNDDLIRRTVINKLICQFELNFAEIESQFSIQFKDYFADELKELIPLFSDGLGERTEDRLKVKDTGRLLIRRICMVFDAYLKKTSTENVPKYSRII